MGEWLHNYKSNYINSYIIKSCKLLMKIAAYGWPFFTNRHSIEQIWHTVDFLFNTVIFMLAGVIIGAAAANTGAGDHGNTVEAADYGSLNMFHTHSTLPDMTVYWITFKPLVLCDTSSAE